ncbi:redoxin domain-containing protein [Chromatiaceae bacterium AAb-1]|nr:redoxin domain-containing protein [Chromatiaceae bacterium AAb-1]
MKKYWLLLLCLIALQSGAAALKLEPSYQVFEGEPVSVQSYIGKQPVYLKLWASWCRECRQELPSLQQAYEQYHDRIAMFAVNLNINETDNNIRRLYQQHKLTIPVVLDNNGSIASNFEFKGTPFHVLINRQGNVVYTTYKDDQILAEKLELLAADKLDGETKHKGTVSVNQQPADMRPAGTEFIYFSATWCDWYMKDLHPQMAENCTNAIHTVARLHQQYPEIPLQAYVTHLWTEATDVAEYRKKFAITYPLTLDQDNARLQQFQANSFPTLIILKNGQEITRLTRFEKPDITLEQIRRFLL